MPRVADSLTEGPHAHIVELDTAIIELVRRRTEICTRLTTQRRAAGEPAIELARENAVLQQYSEALGRPGVSLAMCLTELGRRQSP